MKLSIISGRSGSGKSVCLQVLEDLGYYCIDNLPVSLLPEFFAQINTYQSRVAVSIDARNMPADLDQFVALIQQLKQKVSSYEIVFLDAEESVLVRRFSETRRKHPLSSDNVHLQEALQKELHLLEPIAQIADMRIDTTRLTVKQLRELIRDRLTPKSNKGLSILLESFGYKFGVPADADFVFDVRCLPNPYWEPALRNYTGLDQQVIEYLQLQPNAKKILDDITKFLLTWIPQFQIDNRSYMTVAIGCTGGQHRSVYLVGELAKIFRDLKMNVQVRHREL